MANFIISAFADEAADSLEAQIAACKANKISFIEMRNVNGKTIMNATDEELSEIKKQLDANGMRLSALGSSCGKSVITEDFSTQLDKFKRAIEIAHKLETRYIRMFSFHTQKGEESTIMNYRDEVMDRLSQVLQVTKGSGITLCHENEKHIYGDTAERCRDIYDTFSGEIKLVMDAANFIQCDENVLNAYKLLEDGIEYLHIKDADANKRVVPAGEGIGQLDKVIELFSRKDGDRYLSLEPHLKKFIGPDALYPTKEDAFNAATGCLKKLLIKQGFKEDVKWIKSDLE